MKALANNILLSNTISKIPDKKTQLSIATRHFAPGIRKYWNLVIGGYFDVDPKTGQPVNQ